MTGRGGTGRGSSERGIGGGSGGGGAAHPRPLPVHRALAAASIVGPGVVLGTFWLARDYTGVAVAGMLGVMAGLCVWLARSHRRLARRVSEAGGSVCLRCGYDLRGTGGVASAGEVVSANGAGRCPECGEAFEAGSTRAAWRRWGM